MGNQKKKLARKKKTQRPGPPLDHPLWSTFQEYISDASHFGRNPIGMDVEYTSKDYDLWNPYWDAFLHGVNLGRDQVIATMTKTMFRQVRKTYGK